LGRKGRFDTRTLTTRSIVIAAGAQPFVPPIPGIEAVDYLTSDTVWNLRQRPRRLLVLGGGPTGSELSQAFARLGSKVTQVEMLPRLLFREDPEVSELVMQRFRAEGIELMLNHKAKEFLIQDGERFLIAEANKYARGRQLEEGPCFRTVATMGRAVSRLTPWRPRKSHQRL
jgi:pyruvate/2-oxoglutarate dehydrogenase complex dihydrolipoamide dehydrogenase (E3) component